MKSYIFNVRLEWGQGALAVCAMSESAAKQMILAQDQYDLRGSDLEERNLSLIGECVGFASADGRFLREGEIETLSWYEE